MKAHGEITLSIPAELRFVWSIGVAVKAICIEAGMESAEAGLIELAVVEAVNNSIIHAYRESGPQGVEVQLTLTEGRLEADIRDHGAERDNLPEPRLDFDPQDVNSLPEGQMGWFIINQVMDRVSYRRGHDKNHLFLTKYLSGDVTASGS